MAEMTIRLLCDPATGKKDIVVSLRSDASALAHEHEQMHRMLVEKLIGQGLLQASEVGSLVIEREAEPVNSSPSPQQAGAHPRESHAEGQ